MKEKLMSFDESKIKYPKLELTSELLDKAFDAKHIFIKKKGRVVAKAG